MEPPSRRSFLVSTVAVAAAVMIRPAMVDAWAPAPLSPRRPDIHPRSAWAAGLAATGPLQEEAAGDVRFLLVHHTETPNHYPPEKVVPRLQNIFLYHTGTKGWADIAYNFFVDAHGRIWEGRTGSIDRPVQGDATGGSQGHSLLCCFLGDHSVVPPTPAAVTAMASLTAWLAGTYDIDLDAGPTITFTSRGSNRWPAGTTVTTDPIAGHRDMSQTACPGDAAYPLVRGEILTQAKTLAGMSVAALTTTAAPASPTTEPAASTSETTPTSAPTIEDSPVPDSGLSTTTPTVRQEHADGSTGEVLGDNVAPLLAGGSMVAMVAGGLAVRRHRARRSDNSRPDAPDDPNADS